MTNALEELLYRPENPRNIKQFQHNRGQWCVDLAKIESVGIPIDRKAIQNLSNNFERVTRHSIEECNKVYKFYELKKQTKVEKELGIQPEYQKKDYLFNQFVCSKNLQDTWPLTKGGKYSTEDKVLKDYENLREIELFRTTKKLKREMAAYSPASKKEFDKAVGKDDRIRCYFNAFGTLTSRNAPPTKTFIPAQSKWLRALIRAEPGKAIISADYSTQEFFVAACMSKDDNMIEAYLTGDVYEAFTKQTGLKIPRKISKAFILGVGYGMGVEKAAINLGIDSEQVTELRNCHHELYTNYWDFRNRLKEKYENGDCILLKSGWAFWPDKKLNTYQNFPIQGTAQDMLRKAVNLIHKEKIEIIFPLHDAIYVLCDETNIDKIKEMIKEKMLVASREILGREGMRISMEVHTSKDIWKEDGYEDYKQFLGE